MSALKIAIAVTWIPFWIYWLISATTAKQSRPGRRWTPVGAVTALAVLLIVRVLRPAGLAVHSPVLGMIGTALATNLVGLVVAACLTGLFYYAATVEERNMTAVFPSAYPAYRQTTKMLIPYIL